VNRKHVVAGVVILVIAILIWVVAGGGGGDKKKGAGGGSAGAGRGSVVDPKHPERGGAEAPGPNDTPWQQADPEGTLLLEGQVLDEGDEPVAGAQVWISSQPERTATTEADGSFSFDHLLPREYAVSARSEDAIGGPVNVKVGPGMEPVVVRLREGASLVVRVTGDDGAPIAGAAVKLEQMGAPSGITDAQGKASFRGLGAGYSVVEARAAGFAPTSALAIIGAPGSTQDLAITLHEGAAVAGKVVDDKGAAVADAWVTLQAAGAAWAPAIDGTASGADGSFSFAVVAQGSYVIEAHHPEHAPGTSEIFSVDGTTARDGLVVALRAPGIIRGTVVTSKRAPAPYASVEVAGKAGGEGDFERVTAGADGTFELKNLPRAAMRVHAENDEAGSAIVDVDLAKTPLVEHLELVLDVDGMIAGVVVDSKGEPVAEAQVSAAPDIFKSGSGASIEDLAFAGFTSATTDGGGRFRLRGLPEGGYLLWASRGGAPMQPFSSKGTSAKTGDMEVKLVLPAPGGIEGKVAFAGGEVPKRASVQVGVMPATPVADGAFSVRDLPPGTYDLRVRGPDFADVFKHDIVVKEGEDTDVGTITVARGRTIAGRVTRPDGSAAAGARVLAGQMLFSQGSSESLDPAIEEQYGVRVAVAGADGSFLILGAPVQGGSIIAEDPTYGRSEGVPFAKGDDDVLGVTLQLRGFGSIAGIVTSEDQPVAGAQVFAAAKGSTGHIVVVNTLDDGTFVIEKVAEGDHKLNAARGQGLSRESTSADVHVAAGQRTTVKLDFPVGSLTLKVAIKGKNGAKIDSAQIFLFPGMVSAHNGKEIVDLALSGDQGNITFWLGGADPAAFTQKQMPGEHTLCVIPINGDISDLQFQQRMQEHLDELAVYCQKANLPERPVEQTITATVPPMTPLPP
jgi:protocatechuate 3,4-dioxygenase beta subunit